jgi:ribonuclease P protein component
MDLLSNASLGFPKLSRLLSAKDYGPVFKQPNFRVSSRYLLMLAKSSDSSASRLGIVVAKKNIPKAVQRNRIKRLLRESFRIRKLDFATIDLVVLAKKGFDALENHEIRAQIDTLFQELSKKTEQE